MVLTLNRKDFKRLHKSHPDHAGIIICTDDGDRRAIASTIYLLKTIAITMSHDLWGDRINDLLLKYRNSYGNKPKRTHNFRAAT